MVLQKKENIREGRGKAKLKKYGRKDRKEKHK